MSLLLLGVWRKEHAKSQRSSSPLLADVLAAAGPGPANHSMPFLRPHGPQPQRRCLETSSIITRGTSLIQLHNSTFLHLDEAAPRDSNSAAH